MKSKSRVKPELNISNNFHQFLSTALPLVLSLMNMLDIRPKAFGRIVDLLYGPKEWPSRVWL